MFPAPGKIVVQEDTFKYSGRIVIPEKAERRPTMGTIVAIGDSVGKWDENGDFTPYYELGQRLIYGIYAGTVVNIKGQPVYRFLNMDEVLGRIEGEAELEGVGS
jgi:co-chaperonin GroES (HSP10)